MKAGSLITETILASALEALGQFAFENPGFEYWTDGLPDNWVEVMDTIGRYDDNVSVKLEYGFKSEGLYSARVHSIQPFGGISTNLICMRKMMVRLCAILKKSLPNQKSISINEKQRTGG